MHVRHEVIVLVKILSHLADNLGALTSLHRMCLCDEEFIDVSDDFNLIQLLRDVRPLDINDTIDQVADAFLHPEYEHVLSIAVVHDQQPVGIITRHRLNQMFLKRFGRELYGQRPVSDFMDTKPLVVDLQTDPSEAAAYVTQHMTLPLSADFILIEQGLYRGMGAVLDLLGAMEQQVSRTARDLSKALRSLRNSQAQLVQSEKMAALGQMVAGVAHEINTPLGYVRNNVEMLHELCQGPLQLMPRYEQLMQRMLDPEVHPDALAAEIDELYQQRAELMAESLEDDLLSLKNDTLYGLEQISELVLSLKDFSRMDQAFVEDVDLNTCLENSLLIGRNVLKYGIEVIKDLNPLPRIRMIPSQINQVLLNLLTNAAQAMPQGGKILLRTWADESSTYLSIQDNGCGIDADHLKKIFDPFFTTKPVGQGTGLGLSISYQIIQQHGGRIQVASRPGVGTRFLITLPRPLQQAVA